MINKFLSKLASILLGVCISQSSIATVFSQRAEVLKFIDEVTQQHNIDKNQITFAFSQISTSDEVIKLMTTQYEALPWHRYRAIFINDRKINDGVKFWQKYEAVLQQAQETYGIPIELIVAIIGIESSYGQTRGKFSVLQALATLAFDYPARSSFFLNELKEYLLLTAEHRLDPLAVQGSYAGAIGIPQFIPSSYRNFAVDFDNSGQIDLSNNMQQVIGSVANYFKVHGWQKDQHIISKAKIKGLKYKKLPLAAKNNPVPTLSLTTVHQHDVAHSTTLIDPHNTTVAWLEFDMADGKEYWLGFNNFYVITRYNNSINYALVVHQLSQAIAEKYKEV